MESAEDGAVKGARSQTGISAALSLAILNAFVNESMVDGCHQVVGRLSVRSATFNEAEYLLS